MPTLLLTSFGPFPGCPVNPTERLAARLADRVGQQSGWQVKARMLAVDWRVVQALPAELAHEPRRFDGILALGVATRRSHICVERRAHNATSQKADVSGVFPADPELAPGAPGQLEGRLHRHPFDAIVPALAEDGWPVAYSDDAGRYLCNALFYALLHTLPAKPGAPLLGFVHIPHIREVSADADDPLALPLDVAEGALERLLVAYCRAAAGIAGDSPRAASDR